MQEIAKSIIILGIILITMGVLLMLASKIPLIGRLPGDFLIQRKNLTFYFPLATSILVSAVFSLIFWLLSRR